MARQLARAGFHDGDGRGVPLSGDGARGRRLGRRGDRRLPSARALTRERRLFARIDAPPPRHAERADGVPDHGDDRVGAESRRQRALAQLRCVRRLPARRRRRGTPDTRRSFRPAARGPALPARAPAQLQPEVLPALAPPLLLLRTVERPAAGRARLPARRVAAHPPGPWVRTARSWLPGEEAARRPRSLLVCSRPARRQGRTRFILSASRTSTRPSTRRSRPASLQPLRRRAGR